MDSNQALLLAVVIPTATVLAGIFSNSRINDLGKQIDDVRTDLGSRIEDMRELMNGRFDDLRLRS